MVRPVSDEFPVNQPFGSMATAGVVGNINASQDTVEYYVGRYGNYQPFGHAGCDIKCPEGTPVHAIAAGTVLWADWGTNLPGDDSWGPSGYFRRWALYKSFPGIVTVIQHAGWIGVYAHLSAAHMNAGDTVTEGQQIGLSGGTGGVAPHLHVEALIDLTYSTGNGLIYGRTNPEPYFGGIAAMGDTITPIQEDDDMANVPQGEWADAIAILRSLDRNVITDAKLAKALANVPLEVWSYKNPNLGAGDAFQILLNAVAGTDRLAEAMSTAAAKAAAGGADEETIKRAAKEAITELLLAGAAKK